MNKQKAKWLAVGGVIGAAILTLLAAVPSQTDFDSTYFKTNSLPISIVGNLTNWAKLSTNVTESLWTNLPAFTDSEGGTINGIANVNPIQDGIVRFSVNYLSNYWGDASLLLSIGRGTPDPGAIGFDNIAIYNIGEYAGDGATMTNFQFIYNIGSGAGSAMSGTNGFEIMNIGEAAGFTLGVTNAGFIYNFGQDCGNRANYVGTGSFFSWTTDIYNFGKGAGSFATLTNSQDVYSIGFEAGKSMSGSGLSHIFILGSGGKATNSNDYVFGNSAYNYFFPGSSSRFDNTVTAVSGVSSLATDSFISFTSTGRTNTLGKVGVARFTGTTMTYVVKNNANSPVYTNAVTVGAATEIVQAGGAIVITAGSGVVGTIAPF